MFLVIVMPSLVAPSKWCAERLPELPIQRAGPVQQCWIVDIKIALQIEIFVFKVSSLFCHTFLLLKAEDPDLILPSTT